MANIDVAKAKSTIFVGGLTQAVDEAVLVETFSPFGDVMEVQIPPAAAEGERAPVDGSKHRGFGFVTFSAQSDAQDAIDNMDMNELQGKVLKVNMARPQRGPVQGAGNRAVWETEEWLRANVKTLAESKGVGSKSVNANGEGEEGGDAMEE